MDVLTVGICLELRRGIMKVSPINKMIEMIKPKSLKDSAPDHVDLVKVPKKQKDYIPKWVALKDNVRKFFGFVTEAVNTFKSTNVVILILILALILLMIIIRS